MYIAFVKENAAYVACTEQRASSCCTSGLLALR